MVPLLPTERILLMKKTIVNVHTIPVTLSPAPEEAGSFAGCPRTGYTQYSRRIDLDLDKIGIYPPHNKVRLYGDEYEVSTYSLDRDEIGIVATNEQIKNLLVKAATAGERWKKSEQETIDGRRLMGALSSF